MPTIYKVLGQVNPSSATPTTLYAAPTATQAVVSSIVITNLTSTAATFRLSVRQAAATQTNAMYLAYDVTIAGSDSTCLTLGMTLAATDVITVYASTANVAFAAFGSEIS